MALKLWMVLTTLIFYIKSTPAQHSGSQIWKVSFSKNSTAEVVGKLMEFLDDAKIDVFQVGEESSVFLVKSGHQDVVDYFSDERFVVIVLESDVKKYLEERREPLYERKKRATGCGCIDPLSLPTNEYLDFDRITEYLQYVSIMFPHVTLSTVGYSIENRPIYMVTIKPPNPNRAVFIEGGIHAREWISPASVIYIIDMLAKSQYTMGSVQFNIFPVANPDGYVYSHKVNRLWRKNRRNVGSGCYGVDLNRNWGFQWGVSGSSSNPCSETYRGTSAFSEPETVAIKNSVMAVKSQIPLILSLAVHSYSQLMLYPYGYATSAILSPTSRHNANIALGNSFVAAVYAAHGQVYTNEKSTDLYPAAGTTDDWAAANTTTSPNSYYSYTVELRDLGQYGFTLPVNQIVPTREELWAGCLVLFNAVKAHII